MSRRTSRQHPLIGLGRFAFLRERISVSVHDLPSVILQPTAGRRRLGDAGGHLDQHQRADDHDRQKGRGDDKRRRAAKNGG
jgi:hypothetical protein